MGAAVTYYLADGSQTGRGGRFDLDQVVKLRRRLERATRQPVVGWRVRWTKKYEVSVSSTPTEELLERLVEEARGVMMRSDWRDWWIPR